MRGVAVAADAHLSYMQHRILNVVLGVSYRRCAWGLHMLPATFLLLLNLRAQSMRWPFVSESQGTAAGPYLPTGQTCYHCWRWRDWQTGGIANRSTWVSTARLASPGGQCQLLTWVATLAPTSLSWLCWVFALNQRNRWFAVRKSVPDVARRARLDLGSQKVRA